ncbi:MAG: ion transporter [Bacilli bacterium]|nr:ion transporter [Bacilli bacterium]
MRKRIFEIIETATEKDRLSNIYDIFMMLVIMTSIVSLCFKEETLAFTIIDRIALTIFIIDYLLRLFTADFKLKKGRASFFLYPITPMALIDLLCILTAFRFVSNAFKVLKVFRLIRCLRVLRLFKTIRYSKSIRILTNVLVEQKRPLMTVGLVAMAYIFVSAIIVFNVEPDSFETFFDAIYWATISLTTVGYGDIYPVSTAGRVITMISSIFGIGVIALPSGIVTAGFQSAMMKEKEAAQKDKGNDSKDEDQQERGDAEA